MSKDRKVVAAIRISPLRRKKLISEYFSKGYLVIDFENEINNLMAPGQDGHRQVVNYFGEDFLLKGGKINLRKLWKFLGDDENKIRIFHFMMEPVFLTFLQYNLDKNPDKSFLVLLPRMVNKKNIQRFDSIIG